MDNLSSKLLENAVMEFNRLQGVGKRSALRMVLNILNFSESEKESFIEAFRALKDDIHYCKICNNISDNEICPICASPKRNHAIICVVQDIRDIIAIENTRQFNGIYHVLGGIISPIDGIGPDDLNMYSLFEKAKAGVLEEIILALPTTIEGDTTNYFIYKNIEDSDLKITTIARGISIGDELEYADEVTLGRSLKDRIDFEQITVRS